MGHQTAGDAAQRGITCRSCVQELEMGVRARFEATLASGKISSGRRIAARWFVMRAPHDPVAPILLGFGRQFKNLLVRLCHRLIPTSACLEIPEADWSNVHVPWLLSLRVALDKNSWMLPAPNRRCHAPPSCRCTRKTQFMSEWEDDAASEDSHHTVMLHAVSKLLCCLSSSLSCAAAG